MEGLISLVIMKLKVNTKSAKYFETSRTKGQRPKALDLFKSWCNLIVDHIFIDYLTILCNYNYTE